MSLPVPLVGPAALASVPTILVGAVTENPYVQLGSVLAAIAALVYVIKILLPSYIKTQEGLRADLRDHMKADAERQTRVLSTLVSIRESLARLDEQTKK
jgi:replication-associated recombination protein RarA